MPDPREAIRKIEREIEACVRAGMLRGYAKRLRAALADWDAAPSEPHSLWLGNVMRAAASAGWTLLTPTDTGTRCGGCYTTAVCWKHGREWRWECMQCIALKFSDDTDAAIVSRITGVAEDVIDGIEEFGVHAFDDDLIERLRAALRGKADHADD